MYENDKEKRKAAEWLWENQDALNDALTSFTTAMREKAEELRKAAEAKNIDRITKQALVGTKETTEWRQSRGEALLTGLERVLRGEDPYAKGESPGRGMSDL